MKHSEIALKISAFVDNEVPEPLKTTIQNHLETCPECRAEAKLFHEQSLYMNIAKGMEIEPSSAFRAGVTAAIDSKMPVKAGWKNVGKLIPIPIGMSLLVVVFSIYMIAAPVVYGMNSEDVKAKAPDMVVNAVMSCLTGSVFAPAAFAKLCMACTENACSCGVKCGADCKMKMGGWKNGK